MGISVDDSISWLYNCVSNFSLDKCTDSVQRGSKMSTKYDIEVELVGHDGNAMSIIAEVSSALKRNDVPIEEVREFQNEAMSGDYNHLLRTAMSWVKVV